MGPLFRSRAALGCAVVGAAGLAGAPVATAAPHAPAPLTRMDGFRAALGLPREVSLRFGAARHARPRVDGRIARMIRAGDRIAHLPYVWGGGHGSFSAAGYDCSGSVSYVLHAAGLLSIPADSSGLESFGVPGPGRHVTVYANSEHAWMTIDGRRFDTIAFQETGSRWTRVPASASGYIVRHPAGL